MASVVLKNGSDRDFSRYLREINKFPMLPAETEFGLACRSGDHRDGNAPPGLVTSRLRLVANIAAGCRGHLIVDRTMGPIQADGRFDPDRGFRLASCAMRWIGAAAGRDGQCRDQQKTITEHEAAAGRKPRLPGTARPVFCAMGARGS